MNFGEENHALVTTNKNDWKVWHKRLGHLGKNNMSKLKTSDVDLNHEHGREF